jgi:hypothetical protein
MTPRTAEMLRVDLEAAGVPYETSEGVADFHALRSAYITYLVASGASVKTCQTLARHSDPKLTIGIYAKASLHDIAGAVADLPDLTAALPESGSVLAATGTDSPHVHTLAPILRRSGDTAVRSQTLACAMTSSGEQSAMECPPLENKAQDALMRSGARQGAESLGPLAKVAETSKNTLAHPAIGGRALISFVGMGGMRQV